VSWNQVSGETSFAEHRPDGVEADTVLARDLRAGCAGPVFPDKVVNIEVVAFHGTVNNLQTSLGYFVASGIVTHNCRCSKLLNV